MEIGLEPPKPAKLHFKYGPAKSAKEQGRYQRMQAQKYLSRLPHCGNNGEKEKEKTILHVLHIFADVEQSSCPFLPLFHSMVVFLGVFVLVCIVPLLWLFSFCSYFTVSGLAA